jgi:hypothetical protein
MGALQHAVIALTCCLGCGVCFSQSSCRSGERTYFSCDLGAKHATLCGTPPSSTTLGELRYEFGRASSSPELSFPANGVRPSTAFRFGREGRSAKASILNVQFRTGEYTYTIYRWRAAFEEESAGVAVLHPKASVRYLQCSPKSVIDDLTSLEVFGLRSMSHDEIVEGP